MTTLTEIEMAADVLSVAQKRELIYFLLTRLRRDSAEWSDARDIPKEKIEQWIVDDEVGYRAYLAGT